MPSAQAASVIYAAPTAAIGADGSQAKPYDLQTAFNQPLSAGSTIWVTTGTYGAGGNFQFTSNLTGNSGSPIIVRQNFGDHAIINGSINHTGSYVWFWGFEITNTSAIGRGSPGIRPPGLVLGGQGNKAINLQVHDTGDPGISFVNQGNGGEVYGCLLWANGYTDGSGAVHGSGVDGHNGSGSVLLQDNMAFWNFTNGLRASEQTLGDPVVGFSFQNNASFDNGSEDILAATALPGNPVQGLLIQGNSTFRNNIFPGGSGTPVAGIRAGSGYQVNNNDAIISSNTITGSVGLSSAVLTVFNFQTPNVNNNVVVSSGEAVQVWISTQPGASTVWDDNAYYGGPQVVVSTDPIVVMSSSAFSLVTASYTYTPVIDPITHLVVSISTSFAGPVYSTNTFEEWQSSTSLDTFSNYSPVTPAIGQFTVRPNKYEPGSRAQVVLNNWGRESEPTVDFSGGGLVDGAWYEILDVQNINGPPLNELITFANNNIESRPYFVYRAAQPTTMMNLTSQSESSPINTIQGSVPNSIVQHTPLDFGTFIVVKTTDPIPAPVLEVLPLPAYGAIGPGVVLGSSSSIPFPTWVDNEGSSGTILNWSVVSDTDWVTLSQFLSGMAAVGVSGTR